MGIDLACPHTQKKTHRRKNPSSPVKGWQPLQAGRKDEPREGGEGTEGLHSHRDSRDRAILRQQVARREAGDAKLAHHVALRVQDPAHRYALVLGQVQNHLQGRSDICGQAPGQREP